MISLTRLSGSLFALNSDLIERIDATPDTVITLVNGSKYVVSDGLGDVIGAIRLHRAEVIALSGHVVVTQRLDSASPPTERDLSAFLREEPESPRRPNLSVVTAGAELPDEASSRNGAS